MRCRGNTRNHTARIQPHSQGGQLSQSLGKSRQVCAATWRDTTLGLQGLHFGVAPHSKLPSFASRKEGLRQPHGPGKSNACFPLPFFLGEMSKIHDSHKPLCQVGDPKWKGRNGNLRIPTTLVMGVGEGPASSRRRCKSSFEREQSKTG